MGEIAANWNDGACLRDTVRVKYNINGKDPIPIIRRNISNFLQKQKEKNENAPHPQVFPFISDALLDCESPVFILVGDESHLLTAKSSLEHLPLPTLANNIPWKAEKNEEWKQNSELFSNRGGVNIVAPRKGDRGHEGVLEHILSTAPETSLVHFVHSDISTLQRAKRYFGDYRPRPGMFGKCAISSARLKLSLCSTCSGPQQQNVAEMDPWLNLIHEFELVEALTSKIVAWE